MYTTKQVTFDELKPGMVLRHKDGGPFMEAVVTDIDQTTFTMDRAHPMGRERMSYCNPFVLNYWHAVCLKDKPEYHSF